MRMRPGKADALTLARAEEIAATALAFLAADARQLGQFLAATGLGPIDLPKVISNRQTLAAVLDYILAEESLLLTFSANCGVAPATIAPARDLLADRSEGAAS